MSVVTINGKTYISTGGNLTISGNKITIDGKDVTLDSKEISIHIDGAVSNLIVDACQTCNIIGDCGKVTSTNGDIEIEGNVSGAVTTTNGDISCNNVGGDVSTKNGNIKYRK